MRGSFSFALLTEFTAFSARLRATGCLRPWQIISFYNRLDVSVSILISYTLKGMKELTETVERDRTSWR